VIKAVVMPEESGPRMLSIARFGNVLGYGLDSAGECYYIRQTGRLGAEKYAVEKILAPVIATQIASLIPEWARTGSISGSVPFEVLQNEHARMLISGKRESYWLELYRSLEKGGLIMIPMLLLIPWVAYLTIKKILLYSGTGRRLRREYDTALKHISNKDFSGAQAVLRGQNAGIMANIAISCLERQSQGRAGGERAISEFIALLTPSLNRSLNTLAVIAGAAPLLGLLGTISGMITLFAAVTHYGTGDPKFLAGGISEALITAKTGLSIAIPVLFIHDLLRGAKDRLVADIEKRSIAILNAVFPEG
jgi:biopolymer transport protein ExbB